MSRTNYDPDFKAKIVIEVLEGRKELEAIASENELNPNMVRNWKSSFLKNAGKAFEDADKAAKDARRREAKTEKKVARLLRTVGEVTMERDFLKDCFRRTGRPIPTLDTKGS